MGMFAASLLALLILVLAAFFTTACDPGHSVTFDNDTDAAVTIFIDGQRDVSLKPMEKRTFDVIEFSEATFEARDSTGRVLYRETMTWAGLKERGWKIVIAEPAPPGPSSTPATTS